MLKVSLKKRSKLLPKIKNILLETEAYLNTQVAIHQIQDLPIGKSNRIACQVVNGTKATKAIYCKLFHNGPDPDLVIKASEDSAISYILDS